MIELVVPKRTLPHSVDDEQALLACCMIDGADTISRCVTAGVSSGSFYEPKHASLYSTISALYANQRPTSVDVVASELSVSRRLDEVGGYAGLVGISERASTTANAQFFIEKVCQLATVRAVIKACIGSVERGYDFTGDLDEFMSSVAEAMRCALGSVEESEEKFSDVAAGVLTELQRPEPTKIAGEVSWGLIDIDKMCGKLAPGSLAVLAGMPSTGKSALADQVAWGAAAGGIETVVFTYEMTKRDKAVRIAQQISRVNYDDFYRSPSDLRALFTSAMRRIKDCRTIHVFERDISSARMLARCQSLANSGKKPGLIVVDFLQYLARLEATIGRERTDEKIGRITSACKDLAKKFSCPALLLSSLNREGYRDGQRPTIASLKASGDIESDADVVAILHWPKESPDGTQQDPHDSFQRTFYVEFNQDKGRSKGVHQVGLHFDRKATRFDNYTL